MYEKRKPAFEDSDSEFPDQLDQFDDEWEDEDVKSISSK